MCVNGEEGRKRCCLQKVVRRKAMNGYRVGMYDVYECI